MQNGHMRPDPDLWDGPSRSPDQFTWDLFVLSFKYLELDIINRLLDLLCWDRTLIACPQNSGFNLRSVILLSVIIFFYNNERNRLYFFVCRKSSAAFITRTSSSDRVLSSAGRESITLVSGFPQYGHLMSISAFLFPFSICAIIIPHALKIFAIFLL